MNPTETRSGFLNPSGAGHSGRRRALFAATMLMPMASVIVQQWLPDQAQFAGRAHAEATGRQIAPAAVVPVMSAATMLDDARWLVRQGRMAEAVGHYDQLFQGNPPPDNLAQEYYLALARSDTEGGWEQARDGLAARVRENPQNPRAQLAYAQVLTYQEGARADGIARLTLLAHDPVVAEAAARMLQHPAAAVPRPVASKTAGTDDRNEAALRRDPANAPARRAAITATLQAGNRKQAEIYARDGIAVAPNDPKSWLASADVARASGDNARALQALTRARELRLEQIGYTSDPTDDSTLTQITLVPGDAPVTSRVAATVKLAAFGSKQPPSTTVPVYASADRGDDTPDLPVARPGFNFGKRPTSLSPSAAFVQPSNDPMADTEQGSTLPAPMQMSDAQPVSVPAYVQAGAAPTYPGYRQVRKPAGRVRQVTSPQAVPNGSGQPQDQHYRPVPSPVFVQRDMDGDRQGLSDGDMDGPVARSADASGLARYTDTGFRRDPEEVALAASGLMPGNAVNTSDPMTQEIDRSIMSLREALAPSLQGGLGVRFRSGDSGLEKLTEAAVPLEAVFSPNAGGQIKLTVTATTLNAGSISDANLQRFGTLAVGMSPSATPNAPAFYTGARPASQHAQGVGIDVAYANGIVKGDIGSTPVGFRIQNMIGGIEVAPDLAERTKLRLGIERRAITDSVLAYAGTVDPRSGRTWGGALRDRARAQLEFSKGVTDFFVTGAAGQVTGQHIMSNTFYEGGAGGSLPVFKQGDSEIRVGVNLFYESYAKNSNFFTLGQGGYFSPQSYASALIPVSYRSKVGEDLDYEVGAAVGVQSTDQKASNYYPLDPAMQAQLNAMSAVDGSTSRYSARRTSGLAGNVHGKFDYRISPNLRIGGQLTFQRAGVFDETAATLYARYVFNGTAAR